MRRTRIVTLTKLKSLEGEVLSYTFPVFGRRKVVEFVGRDRVPAFDGDAAAFEIEQVREPGCPWPRWRVIRRL